LHAAGSPPSGLLSLCERAMEAANAAAAAPFSSTTTPMAIDGSLPPPSSSSPSSPPLGAPALRGFFDAVDSGLRFLEKEAAEAEAAAALDEARAHLALVGDGAKPNPATATTQAAAAVTSTSSSQQQKRCSRRAPAPSWAWVADHLLTLVQQYSGGLSEPVMRTSLWQAWRQLVRRLKLRRGFGFLSFFRFRFSSSQPRPLDLFDNNKQKKKLSPKASRRRADPAAPLDSFVNSARVRRLLRPCASLRHEGR